MKNQIVTEELPYYIVVSFKLGLDGVICHFTNGANYFINLQHVWLVIILIYIHPNIYYFITYLIELSFFFNIFA